MFGAIPRDTMAELLLFIAENEKFNSLKELGTLSPRQFKTALEALAQQLKQEDLAARGTGEELIKNLKKDFQNLVGKLAVHERERLLKGFVQ